MARDRHRQFHPITAGEPIIRLEDTVVEYPGRGGRRKDGVRAVDGVNLEIHPGRSLGLVGESGCGKTSLGRAVLDLAPVTEGLVSIGEREGASAPTKARRLARSVQMVFQDPYASLDPRQRIGDAIAEPMAVHRIGNGDSRRARAGELLDLVGLNPNMATAYPHQLSGGQRQRVCIARTLAVAPMLLVCDEPTSALDVSIQAQVVQLLQELQRTEELTYLFITHDLSLLPQLVSDVAVMYLGRVVEIGPTATILHAARHPYTASLLEAVPVLGKPRTATTRRSLRGEAFIDDLPGGCQFRNRCWLYRELDGDARESCRDHEPELRANGTSSHSIACHHSSATGAAEKPTAVSVGPVQVDGNDGSNHDHRDPIPGSAKSPPTGRTP